MFENIRGHTIYADAIKPVSVVVDLGANRSDFSTLMKARFGGSYFLVEANPVLAEEIRKQGTFPIWWNAISAQSGQVHFNVAQNNEGSSLLTLPKQSRWNAVLEKTITVEAITFARFMELAGLTRIDLLKMDIEGAEIEVIPSIPRQTLANIGQITVEFHSHPMFGFSLVQAVEDAIAHLEKNGFLAMDFSEGTRRDVLFINRRICAVPWRQRLMWKLRTHRPAWLTKLWHRVPGPWRSRLYHAIGNN
mgnify:CR=1 FL=1